MFLKYVSRLSKLDGPKVTQISEQAGLSMAMSTTNPDVWCPRKGPMGGGNLCVLLQREWGCQAAYGGREKRGVLLLAGTGSVSANHTVAARRVTGKLTCFMK